MWRDAVLILSHVKSGVLVLSHVTRWNFTEKFLVCQSSSSMSSWRDVELGVQIHVDSSFHHRMCTLTSDYFSVFCWSLLIASLKYFGSLSIVIFYIKCVNFVESHAFKDALNVFINTFELYNKMFISLLWGLSATQSNWLFLAALQVPSAPDNRLLSRALTNLWGPNIGHVWTKRLILEKINIIRAVWKNDNICSLVDNLLLINSQYYRIINSIILFYN